MERNRPDHTEHLRPIGVSGAAALAPVPMNATPSKEVSSSLWRFVGLIAVSPVSQETVAGGNGFMERRVSWLGSEGGRGVKVSRAVLGRSLHCRD